jgi:hypothetical protein
VKASLRRAVAGLIVVTHLAGCATSGKPVLARAEGQCDGGVGLAQGAKAGAAAGVEGFRNSLGVSSCSDLAGCGLIALLLPIFVAGGAIAGAVSGAVRSAASEPGTAGPSCRGSAPDLRPPPVTG